MHNHDEDELKLLNVKLMKALDDDLAQVLEEAGYNTPKYLARKINEVGRWHQGYFDRLVESIGQFISETLERLDLIEEPENYRPLTVGEVALVKAEKHDGWANYVWNVLEQNGVNEKILDEHLELRKYLEENVMTSTAMSTASHLWQAYSMQPRSTNEVSQFFQKTYSEGFINRATRHASQISAKMALTDANALQEAFKIGLTEGNGVYDVIANLRHHPDFNPARSRAFALTEVLTSYSEGAYLGMQESEIVDEKEWIHTGSHKNKPRPHHQALHETRVPVDGYFSVRGHLALYPRDPNLPVGERVNCHCGIEPAIDLDEYGITEEDLEQMRAEARDEIENEYTAEELEQMLVDRHNEFNPNPLPIDQIQTTTGATTVGVQDLTGNNGNVIMDLGEEPQQSTEDYLASIFGPRPTNEPAAGANTDHEYGYNPTNTQLDHESDIDYSDYIEIRNTETGMFGHNRNVEMHQEYFSYQHDRFRNMDRENNDAVFEDFIVETAFQTYTGSSYTAFNGFLRGVPRYVRNLSADKKTLVDAMVAELNQSTLRDNMVLYRGIDNDTIHRMFEGNAMKPGDVITDSAFMSTSTVANVAKDFAGDRDGYIFKIRAPRGSNAMDISFLSGLPAESEVLFQVGSSLKVDRISDFYDELDGINYKVVEAILIQ